jgi:hypothetical protein
VVYRSTTISLFFMLFLVDEAYFIACGSHIFICGTA